MNCPLGTRDQELLVAYSSQKLDGDRSAALEQHIESCEPCRDFVLAQQAVWNALDIWEPEPISADFNRRLYQRIDEQVSWWDRLMQPFRPLVLHKNVSLAAAACVVLAVGFMIDQTANPPGPGAPPVRATAVAEVDSLQPDQVVKALDEMETMSRFNRLMKTAETPESKM